MRHRKWCALLGGVVALTMLMASAAWSCVPTPAGGDGSGGGGRSVKRLTLAPAEAKPGQEITASAPATENRNPIEVRLNTPDGPVVGILRSDQGAVEGTFRGILTIPATAQPGQAALFASQEGANWDPTPLAILDPSTGVAPKVLQSEGAKPPRDTSAERVAAGVAAAALTALAVGVAFARQPKATATTARPALLRRLQPTALVLLAGAGAYAAVRPRLDASLVVIGVITLVAGVVGLRRGRRHFIPIALVVGCWGAAVWFVSQDVIPRSRSSAATVTGLSLGLLLSARLARSEKERSSWLYTGAVSAFNAGLAYYLLYDLPAWFAGWSAWTLTFATWAAWEQFSAGRMSRPTPVEEASAAQGDGVPVPPSTVVGDPPSQDPTLEPSVR